MNGPVRSLLREPRMPTLPVHHRFAPPRLLAALVLTCALGCLQKPLSFEGLAPTQETGGPRVRFDLRPAPLPDVPFPNDLLTRGDKQSPTGRRVNLSMFVPGELDQSVRARFDQL